MNRLLIVSNRLAVSVEGLGGPLHLRPSLGGLATGLASLEGQPLWVGWSGVAAEDASEEQRREIRRRLLSEHGSVAVELNRRELREYYYGFANDVLWPLFHYFPAYTRFEPRFWDSYAAVNARFCDAVCRVAHAGDSIWVHDYQLLLLPGLLRRRLPSAKIGFFLHVPFPSYELFRMLPWRQELLEGVLGADLVGFHTYDYVRHFLSAARRLLGLEHHLGQIRLEGRLVRADVFPMGIDYRRYATAGQREEGRPEAGVLARYLGDQRVVLSVDRLDYSKGILQRLEAYAQFLERCPEYGERVKLVLVVAPSRTRVARYAELKRQIEERIGEINGRFATLSWTPIQYFFRSFPFSALTALYARADVLLVTPLRDGMNLIAKEYLATRQDRRGVLVLSETAGAARELGEALLVNPNSTAEIAAALQRALEMSPEEREQRNAPMLQRIERYDVGSWARDFLHALDAAHQEGQRLKMRRLTGSPRRRLLREFGRAHLPLLLLDYDGTLVPFVDRPEAAAPDPGLLELLAALARRAEVVVISGRGRDVLERWLGRLDAGLVAGHGVWTRRRPAPGEAEGAPRWQLTEGLQNSWKEAIRPVLQMHTARTPGSQVEEKEYSLAWHYRRAEPELAAIRLSELKEALLELTAHLDVMLLEGERVLEIKSTAVSKGHAARAWLSRAAWDFVLAVGDDRTDEDMFEALPPAAWSIKLGTSLSAARYFLPGSREVRGLLGEIAALTAPQRAGEGARPDA